MAVQKVVAQDALDDYRGSLRMKQNRRCPPSCSKGDWSIGADKTPMGDGPQFLFIVPETMRGWLRWQDGAVTDADMGYVRDNFLVQHRAALGDDDESAWEKNPDGTPRDPWTRTYRALLIEMSPRMATSPSRALRSARRSHRRRSAAPIRQISTASLMPSPLCSSPPRRGSTKATARSRAPGSTLSAGLCRGRQGR